MITRHCVYTDETGTTCGGAFEVKNNSSRRKYCDNCQHKAYSAKQTKHYYEHTAECLAQARKYKRRMRAKNRNGAQAHAAEVAARYQRIIEKYGVGPREKDGIYPEPRKASYKAVRL